MSRLSIHVLMPASCSAEDCEEFLKSPRKFMLKHGGEIEFLQPAEGLRFHRVPQSKVHSFASPEDART